MRLKCKLTNCLIMVLCVREQPQSSIQKNARYCLHWNFVMMRSIVVLGTQIYNIKMRSLKIIIKSIAQKVMVEFGFGCRFRNVLKLGFFSHSLTSF